MIKPNVHSKVPCYDEEKSSCLIDTNDLNMARQIQAAMIPKTLPAADGIDIASLYLPCVSVGGDLFDVVRISEDVFGFVIFDVAGHGISSVLIAAMAKVCFANHLRAVQSPRAIIERVNNEIVRELSADFYITAFVGILDLHDNRLLYSNAGHAYPLVYRKKEHELVPLRTQGTFIGIFQDGFYEEQNIFLNPGDWLILFTDGIFRAFSGVDAFKGRKRLESAILDEIAGLTPEKFLKTIRNKCIMATLNEQDDDYTPRVA